MSSSSSSASSLVQDGYVECYKVLYSPGERTKPGNRSWNEGLMTYYTINKKLILRDNRGVLLAESFTSPPPAFSSMNRQLPQHIKEEGIRSSTYPLNVTFDIDSGSYTIEIEQIKFINRQRLNRGLLLHNSKVQRKSKIMTAFFKDIPNVLSKDYKYSEDKTIHGTKRKANAMSPRDTNTTPSRQRVNEDNRTSEKAPWEIINVACNRGRASGLSKKVKKV